MTANQTRGAARVFYSNNCETLPCTSNPTLGIHNPESSSTLTKGPGGVSGQITQ